MFTFNPETILKDGATANEKLANQAIDRAVEINQQFINFSRRMVEVNSALQASFVQEATRYASLFSPLFKTAK